MEKKENNKPVIIAALVGVVVLIAVVLAVVLPIVNIGRDFDSLVQKMNEFESPRLIITDMSSESNFSGKAGEVSMEENSAKVLIRDLTELAEDLKYDSRDTSIGAWDVRFKVIEGDDSVEIYLAEERVYFIKNDVKYIFTPKNDEAMTSYKAFYNGICVFVK